MFVEMFVEKQLDKVSHVYNNENYSETKMIPAQTKKPLDESPLISN